MISKWLNIPILYSKEEKERSENRNSSESRPSVKGSLHLFISVPASPLPLCKLRLLALVCVNSSSLQHYVSELERTRTKTITPSFWQGEKGGKKWGWNSPVKYHWPTWHACNASMKPTKVWRNVSIIDHFRLIWNKLVSHLKTAKWLQRHPLCLSFYWTQSIAAGRKDTENAHVFKHSKNVIGLSFKGDWMRQTFLWFLGKVLWWQVKCHQIHPFISCSNTRRK